MTILVESKRKKRETIEQHYPGAHILDVTSRAAQPWVKCSPFYPHGAIPVPLSPGYSAASMEGIWQGLKVFANTDVDLDSFANTTMKSLKRTVRTNGPVQGHRAGVHGTILLSYRRGALPDLPASLPLGTRSLFAIRIASNEAVEQYPYTGVTRLRGQYRY